MSDFIFTNMFAGRRFNISAMDIFVGKGYDEFGKGNFSMGNMPNMANGMGNMGNFNMGNMAAMANGMGDVGNFGVDSLSKSNCSSGSIFSSPDFREAAEKLRDQVKNSSVWRILPGGY